MSAQSAPARLRVAWVLRPHGVLGEVRAEPLGGDAGRFAPGLRLHAEDGSTSLVVRSVRPQGEHVLLGFEGVDSPEQAGALRQRYLCVETGKARTLGPGEWFVWQLVGMEVHDTAGNRLGVVTDVEPGVAHDVLVVQGDPELLRFPMVAAFVSEVDTDLRRITLHQWRVEP